MSHYYTIRNLEPQEGLFTGIIELAIKSKDKEFLFGSRIFKLGEYLGVNLNACKIIQDKLIKKYGKKWSEL